MSDLPFPSGDDHADLIDLAPTMAEAILAWSDELLPVLQEGGASIPEYVVNLHRVANKLRDIDKEQA